MQTTQHVQPRGRAGGMGSSRQEGVVWLLTASAEPPGRDPCLVPTLGHQCMGWERGENLHGTCEWLLLPGLCPWPVKCLCWWAALAREFINWLSIARVLSLWISVDQLKSAWKRKKEREDKEEVWKYSSLPGVTLERQIACLRRYLSFIQPGCSSGK